MRTLWHVVFAIALSVYFTLGFAYDARAEEVPIKPFVELGFDLLKVAATAMVSIMVPWALTRWARNLDENTREKARAAANSLIQTAINKAQAEFAGRDMGNFEVQSQLVASGLNYVATNGRGIMKNVGIDVSSEAGRAEAADKLTAVIAPAVLVAASVPETVTVAQAFTSVNRVPLTMGSVVVPARIS